MKLKYALFYPIYAEISTFSIKRVLFVTYQRRPERMKIAENLDGYARNAEFTGDSHKPMVSSAEALEVGGQAVND